MAFTVADFEDLYRLLAEHPEWRDRLRPLILGDEFLQVPARLQRIEQLMEQMVERQAAFEDRQAAFEDRQTAFEERLASIEQAIRSLTIQISEIAELVRTHEYRLNRMDSRMGNIEGLLLEGKYERGHYAWFGRYLRRPDAIRFRELEEITAAVQQDLLSDDELHRLDSLDSLISGRSLEDGQPLMLAVEISQTTNIEDVDRAERAAAALRKAGYRAAGMVGGYQIEDIVRTAADAVGVIVDLRKPPETLVA